MGVLVPLPLLVHHSPTYPFNITLGSLKVGLVLGRMHCDVLPIPEISNFVVPHLYCSLYILLSIFSRSWAGFTFCLKLKFIPTPSVVVINPLFIPVQVLVMSVLWIVALCLHKLDQDAVIYVGLGNLEAFKAVNSVVESPLFTLKRGF